eukprot:m.335434 g.335434  ORF g.335434 m.335434 type:complete len:254 (+) comp27770_c0_seq5:171-932(+)
MPKAAPRGVTKTSTSLGALGKALPTLEEGSKELLAIFHAIEGNAACVDCAALQPDWASVTLGCLVCLECSGKHRALGVRYSFVRSVKMDKWSEKQIALMKAGGNTTLNRFLTQRGVAAEGQPAEKYKTPAGELYRVRLDATVEGREPPDRLSDDREAQFLSDIEMETARQKPKESPDWTPDGSSACCEECFVKFNVFRRRHHCRRCGRLVCDKCAPKDNTKPILEFGVLESVRHCLKCYVTPKLRDRASTMTQ